MSTSPAVTSSRPSQSRRRCGPDPGIRRSKTGRWRALVLILVHVAIALHIAHWLSAGETVSPLEPSEAMEFSKGGIINAGFVFFALMILSTAVLGRWFCGWSCHLVAVQDGSLWLLKKLGIRPRPFRSRLLLVVPFIAFGWMFLWPVAYRLYHDLGFGYQGAELETTGFWDTFPPWPIAVATLLVSGGAIIYFLGAKGFCTYACPYGAILGVMDRFAPARIRVTDACEGCGHCTAACSSNVTVHAEVRDYGAVVDPGCMKCMDCVSVCPNDALYFGFGRPEIATKARVASPFRRAKWTRWSDFSFGEELLLGLLFVVGYLVYHGLFNSVPFLFSLAIAGMFAFLGLRTAQLFYRANVNVQRVAVKRNGRLTGAGAGFAASVVAGVAFTGYGAVVQYNAWRMERAWEASDPLLTAWWEDPGRQLSESNRRLVTSGLGNILTLERIAPFSDPRLPQRAAVFELLLGDAESFVARLERAMAAHPERALFPLTLAHYRAVTGDPDAAFELYGRALELELEPEAKYTEERRRVIDYATWLGDPLRAEAVMKRALATHPGHAGVLLDLGVVAARSNRGDEAQERFEAALAADPAHVGARGALVELLGRAGRLEEALEHQLVVVRLTPDDPRARLACAEIAAALERWELSEEQLTELCARHPELPIAWVYLAQTLERLGDLERAAEARARAEALERGPTLPEGSGPR